jgi:hypothetical protein
MVFLNINTKNYNIKDNKGLTKIEQLNNLIQNPKSKVFILFYMEGCGPCNAARPEWAKLKNILKNYIHNPLIGIVDIDQILSEKLKHIVSPRSFPTMRFITNGGKSSENYEDSNIKNKDRSIDSFVNWIKEKINTPTQMVHHLSKKHRGNNYTRKNKKGGKWSLKYKHSINCKKPKGFSQKQYCKYSRK